MNEQLEIDFLPVDSGEKSGDAIAFRYGDFSSRKNYKVVVIDGGTKSSGNSLVKHIRENFDTNFVDLVICTHPDGDHASGLREVLNQCEVGALWIHKPWDHSDEIRDLFHDGRITSNSLSERLKKGYTYAHELVEIAEAKDIDVFPAFAGRQTDDGIITILGPTVEYYKELLPNFARSPQAKVFNENFNVFNKAITWINETLNIETLDETGETSAENLSSAVVLLDLSNRKYLFTGDAGIESLKNVIEYSEKNFIDISNVHFMQIPHHGSKRNISPSILNKIKCNIAYVSVSKDAIKHPARKVTNAFKRRGVRVYSTSGKIISHNFNSTNIRQGYETAQQLPFYDEVEE